MRVEGIEVNQPDTIPVIKISPAIEAEVPPKRDPDIWDVCDEQYDILMHLHHGCQCHCSQCIRRDALIFLLMRPMR